MTLGILETRQATYRDFAFYLGFPFGVLVCFGRRGIVHRMSYGYLLKTPSGL